MLQFYMYMQCHVTLSTFSFLHLHSSPLLLLLLLLLLSSSCHQLHITPEQRVSILRVLGQVHIADDTAEEDIKGKEQFQVYTCMYRHKYMEYI